jgi:hypothetical protein
VTDEAEKALTELSKSMRQLCKRLRDRPMDCLDCRTASASSISPTTAFPRQIAGRRRTLCRSAREHHRLSFDGKSRIQALDRMQPGLPLKKGRAGATTHDYERHGTTTLFAATNVLDGT